jgi:aspartate/methionine/tyrosine aminotransferase
MSLYAERMARLGNESAFKVGEDIRRVEAKGKTVIKLNLGEPDFNSADNINRAAINNILSGNSHYVDPQGILPFRESIAHNLAERRGICSSPERVVVVSGGKPPIGYSLLTYVNPGDEVIYPNPGFPIYESWIKFVQAKPMPLNLIEERDFRFDLAELERLVTKRTKLVIINSPSNPTGGVLTWGDLAQIAEILKAKAHPEFRVLSDEVYEEIVFDNQAHLSIISQPGMEDHTIILNSHSKTFAMTGWRVGYALLPTEEEAQVFKKWNINTFSCTPPFIQMAAKEALDNPENQVIVAAMRDTFQKRRDVIVEELNQIQGIKCVKPAGAFYAFPNIEGVCRDLGALDYWAENNKQGVKVPPPSTLFQLFALYYHGVATLDRTSFGTIDSQGQHYLRISLACDLETLNEGVRRLKAATADMEGFKEFLDIREKIQAGG